MKTARTLFLNLTFFLLMVEAAPSLYAQEIDAQADSLAIPEGYELVDSLVYRFVPVVDSTLVGSDVFHIMPLKGRGDAANVEIYQSQEIADAVREQIAANSGRSITGYRVRIFFDNKQTARKESEELLDKFTSMHRDIKAYRTYVNPYFKITVGDFRTRSEAMELLSRIKHEFPNAFVVKENIEFPMIDKADAYIVDTVKVLRPIQQTL